jgi:hypothetical protein
MTPKPEEKSHGFTREEAKLNLNKVLKHHGMQPPSAANAPVSNEPTHESPRTEGSPDKFDGDAAYQGFHFLIRVVECAVTLHCHVMAQSAAEARFQLERIPNLIKWREISAQELADLTKTG